MFYKYVYSPEKAENNKQIDIQNRWTDCVDRQNDELIKYNTTKHSIKTDKNPQPNMQTFDKIKLDKMVIHAYTKTYYTKVTDLTWSRLSIHSLKQHTQY